MRDLEDVCVPKSAAASPLRIVIRASNGAIGPQLKELWDYRELLYFLVKRDIQVRYKQTVLGVAWAVIQPFLTMVVFSLIFGKLGRVPSDGLPYPIFAYCGLLPWQLFAFGLSESANSLVNNQNLIKKVYFPRLLMPMATVVVGAMDFLVSSVVLIVMIVYYRITPSVAVLALPFFLVLTVAAALAVGLWLSALNVRYRDVRYTIPFLTQLWFFATPVIYPTNWFHGRWRFLYGLNPMVGVTEGFRWALVNGSKPDPMLGISILAVIALLIGGFLYFRTMERAFADLV